MGLMQDVKLVQSHDPYSNEASKFSALASIYKISIIPSRFIK